MSWQDIHLPFCLVNQDAFGKMKKSHRSVTQIKWCKRPPLKSQLVAISTTMLRHFLWNLFGQLRTDFFGANPARQVQKRRISGIVTRLDLVFSGVGRKHGRAKGNYPARSRKAKKPRNVTAQQCPRCAKEACEVCYCT